MLWLKIIWVEREIIVRRLSEANANSLADGTSTTPSICLCHQCHQNPPWRIVLNHWRGFPFLLNALEILFFRFATSVSLDSKPSVHNVQQPTNLGFVLQGFQNTTFIPQLAHWQHYAFCKRCSSWNMLGPLCRVRLYILWDEIPLLLSHFRALQEGLLKETRKNRIPLILRYAAKCLSLFCTLFGYLKRTKGVV